MADGDAATRKQKFPVRRTIGLLLMPSALDLEDAMASALYKFNIDVSSTSDESSNIVTVTEENMLLYPIGTFFKHEPDHVVDRVSCGIIGSKLFLFPHEISVESPLDRITTSEIPQPTPLQFDFLNNKTDALINFPQTLKVRPFVIPVHDKLYVLSVASMEDFEIFEPAFEAYDTTTGSWEPLPHPPFYNNPIPDCNVMGYTVLTTPGKDEVFIIVMGIFSKSGKVGFFSYNTQTHAWKPVLVPKGAEYPTWLGETVAVGGHIYVKSLSGTNLEAFPIRYCEEMDGFSVGMPFKVEGLRMEKVPEEFMVGIEMAAIANIGDRVLCVVKTSFPYELEWQYVHVSIIQIREDDPSSCETLSSIMFGLPKLTEEHPTNSQTLMSCFALALDVTSFMDQIEEGRDRKNRVVNYISDVKGSGDNSSMCQ